MRALSVEPARAMIRVNRIHPTSVDTDMIHNQDMHSPLVPNVSDPSRDGSAPNFQSLNALPFPWAELRDASNPALFLASDEARSITGVARPVDAVSTVE